MPTPYPVDFNVYLCAAKLVRSGKAALLYTGADTGANPQKLIAPPGSPILQVAQSEGLPFVGLYVYPPILADLLLPLAPLHAASAARVWLWLNGLFLVCTAALLARLVGYKLRSWKAALLLVALVCFTPILQCLHDGQITILLLLLWAGGLVLMKERRPALAAVVFALATAIKLTPILVLLPFVIWRQWRFVTAFLLSLLAFLLAGLWIDTPRAFLVFFDRVLPAMSGALPVLMNFSLPAATEQLVTLWHSGSAPLAVGSAVAGSMRVGRLLSGSAALALLIFLLRGGRRVSLDNQVLVVGLLGLLAPILSPVSWFHAYATAFVAFALLWAAALRPHGRRVSTSYLVVLTAVSLLLGSAVSENLLTLLSRSPTLDNLATVLQFAQLALAAGLVFYHLARISKQPELSLMSS